MSLFYLTSNMDYRKILVFFLLLGIVQAQWNRSFRADGIDYLSKTPAFLFDSAPVLVDSAAQTQSRALVLSLLWPGAGQFYKRDAVWKPVLFSAIEIAGIAANLKWKRTSERLHGEFESFADQHWALQRWYENTRIIFPDRWQDMIKGTHKLTLDIGGAYTSTDHLIEILQSNSWNQIEVVRDRDFYENIGKYDQFVGGWDDPYDDPFDTAGNWYTVKKGKTQETYILTKRKDRYRGMRHRSNLYSSYARYAATTLMFNHLISGVDASGLLKRRHRSATLTTTIDFVYQPEALLGVGGVRLNLYW